MVITPINHKLVVWRIAIMNNETKARRVMFLENMTHYLTAFVIIIKGLDKVAVPGKTWIGVLLLVFGVFIILGTIFHHKLHQALKHFKALVFAIEAVVMSIVGYLYVKDGKQFIQYVCFGAAIMFAVALIVYLSKAKVKSAH
jgi:predicted MFS family arabinose efflux permease